VQLRQQEVRQQERSKEIRREHGLVAVPGHRPFSGVDAGAVHQDVDLGMGSLDRERGVPDRGHVPEVAEHHADAIVAGRGGDLLPGRLAAGLVAGEEHDGQPDGGQLLGDRTADARRRARHERRPGVLGIGWVRRHRPILVFRPAMSSSYEADRHAAHGGSPNPKRPDDGNRVRHPPRSD
jgi:hypothetical protein